jgi:hypothetical protein
MCREIIHIFKTITIFIMNSYGIIINDYKMKVKYLVSDQKTTKSKSVIVIQPQMGVEELVGSSSVTVAEASGTVDPAQTTQFVSDANVVTVQKDFSASVPRALFTASHQTNVDGIVDFLQKPFVVQSGTLGTADVATTFTTIIMPGAALSNTIYRNKTEGFLGFRATTVYRLVINGNPFQQGRYMLTYVPFGGSNIGPNKMNYIYFSHTYTNTQRTQLTRIELDVNCDTEGVMRIPFDSALNYYPFGSVSDAQAYGSWGFAQLFPYSPLVAPSGTATVNYTIYASFEDVELVGASVPQMGRENRASPSEVEAKNAGQGPVSGVLSSISSASRALASIPLLSSYAMTTSWAADILAKTAKSFGYSKPSNLGPNTRITQGSAYYFGNVDGFDQGIALAASSENSVKTISGLGGSNLDEMAFEYMSTIPSFFSSTTWTTSTAVGNTLFTVPNSPANLVNTDIIGVNTVVNYTPVAFVANHFSYWRGSLIYRFKIVKTAFHSGRLAFCFFPKEIHTATPSNPSYANSSFIHRQIVDIRTCNEVTIEVPYVSSSSFLEAGNATGDFVVYVVDSLVAVGAVSVSVTILVEVSGGADFEVCVPNSSLSTPVLGVTPQSGNDCEIINTTVGSTDSPSLSLVPSEICVGEKIQSWKAFAKIYRPVCPTAVTAINLIENFWPFAISAAYWTGSAWTYASETTDFISEISSCFLYSRGGMRIKKFTTTSGMFITYSSTIQGITPPTAMITRLNQDGQGVTNPVTQLMSGKFIATDTSKEKWIEFLVPQYMPRHSRVLYDSVINPTATFAYNTGATSLASTTFVSTFCSRNLLGTPNQTFSTNIFRAAADDFQLGGFISIPPMISTLPLPTNL